jgi:hypothetical protein
MVKRKIKDERLKRRTKNLCGFEKENIIVTAGMGISAWCSGDGEVRRLVVLEPGGQHPKFCCFKYNLR